MALDFHRLDNNEFLFGLEDKRYRYLFEIFETFKHLTGISIDQYSDLKLTTENQQTLIKIIDKYIDITDLNRDSQKASAIIGFKGLLTYFVNMKIDLELLGD